jgi:superfamily II DNA or RNA helicase
MIRREAVKDINYVIVDECHHSVSESFKKIITWHPEAKCIGMTATPYRLDGKGLGKIFDEIINVATISELIEAGYLVKPEYYGAAIEPNLAGIKKIGGDYNQKELGDRVRKKNIIMGVSESIKKYLALGKHIVVYAVDREHANDIYNEIGADSMYLDGKTHHVDRKDILTRFNIGLSNVIINVNVLTEGWDSPICDCIVLARPTCSTGLYMQMTGRGLRPYKNKDKLLVIDHGGNVQRHGFVEEPKEFTLEDGLIVGAKKPEKSLHTCTDCLAIFYGMSCPLCGKARQFTKYEIIEQQKEIELIKNLSANDEVKKKDYLSFLNWAMFTGRPPGAAYGRYKTKYGVSPKSEWQKGLVRFEGGRCVWSRTSVAE